MKQKKKQIFIISGVLLVLVALLGVAAWFMTRPEAGIENVTKDELNVEWYDENEKEFTITTEEELFEFAQLSSYYNFKGQTIKLGADIVVNEGNADEWGTEFPEKVWDKPIDSFAGTFDGQGHTISGIYCMGYLYKCSGKGLKPLPAGLFSNTKPECVIKNFRLVNSYFEGDLQDGAGTISACGGGTFDSIYSDATLISYKYWNGGIIGKATESTTITNCWFDGDIQVIGGYARYTAGIMGRAMNKEADFLIEHCLVTGTMYNETEKTGVAMGAILGNALDSATVTINDCFVDADLTNEYKVAVGSVYGVSEENATVNVTNTYATTESYERMVGAVLGIANGMPVGYEREMLKGNGGYQWTSLDFDKYWSVVEGGTPILTTFADKTPSLEGVERYVDLSWYTDEATEYVLLDKADLYGFSLLTQSWDFKDKTIKLGADIVVNEGKASAWAKEAPALEWISAGPKSKPFAGNFDGQMHTISGIYLDSDVMNTGLFSVTAEESTIKNLKLKNSYFKSEASFTGSIVGQGRGKIDTVYSDATVIASKGGIGGFVGLAYGNKGSVKNCWFAGTVINASNLTGERGTGGIIGTVYDEASVKVENCLNTGTVDVRAYTFNQAKEGKTKNVTPIAGGIVGWVRKKTSSLDMTDCLNTGKVLVSNAATGGYGSILGYSDGDTTIEHTYATTESSALTAAKIKGWVLAYAEAKLTGYEGYRWTTLNFDKYWSVMEKGTPVLTSFAGKGVSVSNVSRMVDTSWYDEKKDTYVLTDAADLYGFAYLSNGTDFAKKTIKLNADITLNSGNAADWANAAPALVWRPIASKNLPFAGTFDGQLHTISGIYMNADTRNSGLFSATGETSVVKNLKLTNSYFTSTAGELGSVAGQGRGTFDTVYSEAIVVGNSANIGGLVGMGYGEKVVLENCWFNGNVTNTANHKNNRGTGGLVGTLYDGCHAEIKGCLNTGAVDVTAYTFNQDAGDSTKKANVTPIAGGLVGWVKTDKSSVNIEDCLNTAAVLVDKTATGGYGAIIGYSENVSGTKVSITYSTVSPLAGSKITGKIYQVSEEGITGYKGYQWTLLDFDKYWAVVKEGTPILKVFASEVPSLANIDRMIDVGWHEGEANKEQDVYVISTKEQLYGFAKLSQDPAYNGFKGKIIKLAGDIVINTGDISSWNEWTSIGSKERPFEGTFDGGMYTISGLYVNADSRNSGMFGVTGENSVVKNLKVTNSYFTSTSGELGSIAGQGRGTFDTIYSEAIVIGNSANIGGLVGMGYGTNVKLKNCWFNGTVTNTANDMTCRGTGGIIGTLYDGCSAKIEGCKNTGIVDVTAYQYNQGKLGKVNIAPLAGGIVGWVKTDKSSVEIIDCQNTGKVLAHEKVTGGYGAIVGYSDNVKGTVVSNVYTTTTPVAGSKVTGKIFLVSESIDNITEMIDVSWLDEATGTERDPYLLSSKQDLYGFAMLSVDKDYKGFKGKTFKLTNDIAMNTGDISEWDEWTPIGSKAFPFAGVFDGQMHTISGIYVNTDTRNSGLFSVTGGNSVVKNLKLKNSRFESTAGELGSIAGQGRGTFSTIYSDATVIGNSANTGGLVGMGYGEKVVMKKCWFDGTVTNTANEMNNRGTGGLIGTLYDGCKAEIKGCLNSGTVDVTAYSFDQNKDKSKATTKNITPIAGGIVGWVKTKKSSVKIDNCLNTKEVLAYNEATGGYGSIVGLSENKTETVVSKTYTTVKPTTQGFVTGNVFLKVEEDIKGYAGYQWTLLDFDKYWAVVDDGTPIIKVFADSVPKLDKADRMVNIDWLEESSGDDEKNAYLISDRKDLYGLAMLSAEKYYDGFEGKFFKLDADIVVNTGNAIDWNEKVPKYSWTPIGSKTLPFKGQFDGDMHTISGIYLNADTRNSGFFAVTGEGSVVKNLKLKNSRFESTAGELGSIAGQGRGTFSTIYSDAIVIGNSANTGGLVGMGYGEKVVIEKCWFDGTVTNTANEMNNRGTGGLIGTLYDGCHAEIKGCLNSGTVDVTAYQYNQGRLGKVNITPIAAGLVGWVKTDKSSVKIENCLNTKEVLVHEDTTGGYGAIVGYSENVDETTVSITYSTVSPLTGSKVNGKIYQVSEEDITGFKGYQWTILDFDKYWAVVVDDTPIIKALAEQVPSLADTNKMIALGWLDDATGTSEDPYRLLTKEDLYGFAMLSTDPDYNGFKGKTIKIEADLIEVNTGDVSKWNEWTPIGSKDVPFEGTFDGGMNTISGIYVKADTRNSGFFAVTGENSVVKNLKLTNSRFESTAGELGSIAGQGRGTFDTIYSDATVHGNSANTGGLVGMGYGDKVVMEKCWFDGTVKNTANDKNNRGTGGLIGTLYDGCHAEIKGCLNSGTVDVTAYTFDQNTDPNATNITPIAGGLVGWVKTDKSSVKIENCLSTKEVLAHSDATGGYGAIVGLSENKNGTEVTVTYSTVSPTLGSKVAGKVYEVSKENIIGYKGYQWTILDFDKYWAVVVDDKATERDESGTPIIKALADKVPSLKDTARMIDLSWFDKATGTSEDPYKLYDKEDLYGFAMLSTDPDYNGFKGKTITIEADLIEVNTGDVSKWNEWTPIGSKDVPFEGTFDGGMNTISGIYVNADTRNSGFFAVTGENSVVKNLKLTNSRFESTAGELGSIAGQGRGRFDTIYSDATVNGNSANIGGLVGMGYGDKVVMEKCWFDGTVKNTANDKNNRGTGGLIGTLYDGCHAEIKGCLNSGTVDVTAYTFDQNTDPNATNITPIAGGIVGWVKTDRSSVKIENCLSTKEVLTHSDATGGYGAIVGLSENKARTVVSKTYSTVKEAGQDFVTGNIFVVSENDIKGYDGYKWTVLDFDTYWAVVEGKTPIIKAWADTVPTLNPDDKMLDIDWLEKTSGNNEAEAYILSDRQDLYGLAMLSAEEYYEGFVNKFFKLDDDIAVNTGDANDWDEKAPKYSWTPIGSKNLPFKGFFDGDTHTISGIYLNSNTVNSGFFSVTGAESTVKNLKLKNSYITSTQTALGSIVGQGRGLIDTVYSDAIVVSSTAQVGGLVGMGYGAKLTLNKCWFAGSVTNTATAGSGRGTGGLVGIVYSSGTTAMTDCLNSATIDASASTQTVPKAGGLTGNVEKNAVLTTTNCLNVGTVKVASGKLGGIIAGCIDGGNVTINTSYGYGVNCVVGYMQNSGKFVVNYVLNGTSGTADKTVNNNYVGNVPVVTSFQTQANFIGETAKIKLEGLDFNKNWSTVPYNTPILKAFETETIDTNWYKASESTYTLKDKADLYGLAVLSQDDAYNGFAGKTIELGADIVVNAGDAKIWGSVAPRLQWIPIGTKTTPFAGTFDGKMHTISGIYLSATTENTGFFSVTHEDSKIRNLRITNSYLQSTDFGLGSVAGQGRGLIDTVYSDAIVVGSTAQVGGFVGLGYGAKQVLNQCWFNGTVTNTATERAGRGTGGLIGVAYTGGNVTLTDCLNSGTVDASASTQYVAMAGGFTGNVEKNTTMTLTNCLNVGTITVASGKLGGFFSGCIDGGTVTSNTSYGNGNICTVGYMQNSAKFTVNYVLNGTSGTANKSVANNYLGNVPVITSMRTFTGEDAQTSLEGFDFNNIWSVTEATPVLKALAK